ncbi:HK97 gp10 family phage protein [Bacillus hominis]|uniref:HK97 gp10 family phage protein n=1 Tax=Bacillus hominis TaxID=2817478 RepID=A0ABT7RA73_9BACI|nr:HK97 gp10 family phage protein [Bacillus hominis]MDM5439849.1 HK97 gp10 family phage protein [Bacillus hominis]
MTSINDLASEIAREMQRYGNAVKEDLEVAEEEVTDNLVDELKQNSPKGKRKGARKYSKGWRKKKVGNATVVYNAWKPQLTHLLEKGHAKATGGGRVPAKVHIAPAEEKAINEYLAKVERAVQQ